MYTLKCLVSCFLFASALAAPEAAESVKVSLFYEGLCEFCHDFVLEQLYPAYQKLGDAIEVELVPYGNTRRYHFHDGWEFDCQHGEAECYSNKLQACVINQNVTTSKTLDFVNCLFGGEADEQTGKQCSETNNLDWAAIKACTDGDQGVELLLKYAEEQEALENEIRYVPWILIDDVHDQDKEDRAKSDLVGLVCDLLSQKPSAC